MKLCYAFVAVLALALAVSAQPAKVGYVDSDEVIAKYEEAREAKSRLERDVAGFRTEAESLRSLYQEALDEYQTQELSLSEEGKRARMAEVEQLKRRYDLFVEEVYRKGGKIDQKNSELIAPLVQKIGEVVSEVAKQEGFTLVLDASKAEILYSSTGLDLTRLVIDELNREYAAVGPVTERNMVYAILPVFATNDEARQERIDLRVREFIYNLVRVQPKTDMVANARVDEQLTQRGVSGRAASGRDAIDVGTALNVDYAILGTCTRQGRQIDFTLTIVDIRMSNEDLKTETGQTQREERLNEEVGRVVQVLLASVVEP
ncbi:MAG TPA: OmpH family outer membrane protein [candidate division WOR-3 bacterium]|uniref:OmpH family outer membrane protein n=1 Tax=candidate division WOR-3 bacterium TaxID=2052148 RepID=A0A7V0T727_UNCW3|nr:OmpH family outer membrane protein [candidate division WOR-3 bacterium]